MSVVRLSTPQGHIEVDPAIGGRVTRLVFDGFELLTGPDVHPDNFGSTYWPSPQSLWGWPPIAALDSAAYEVVAREPLTLRSPVAELAGARVVLDKTVIVSEGARGTLVVDLDYRLENVGGGVVRVAGWEISRVPPDGLTFYPTGGHELRVVAPHAELLPEYDGGVTFFDHRARTVGANQKLHADGREGFLAHFLRRGAAGTLFLKLFRDTTSVEQAEGEGEVEIFSNEDGRYVEVEVQGPSVALGAGESSHFSVRWVVVDVSSEIAASRARLVDLARSLAAEFRPESPRDA